MRPEPSLRACGARPSAGRPAPYGWPSGEDPRTTRKAFFSEGRAPRVRVPTPDSSRGISSPEMAGRAARGPIGRFHDEARAFLKGVRSPPLRGVGYPSSDGLAGKTLA